MMSEDIVTPYDSAIEPPKPILTGEDIPKHTPLSSVSFYTSIVAWLSAFSIFAAACFAAFASDDTTHRSIALVLFILFILTDTTAIVTGIISYKTRLGKTGLASSLILAALATASIIYFGSSTDAT